MNDIEEPRTNWERLEKALLEFIEHHTKETSATYTPLVPAMAEVLLKLWT